jgi:hypothetical protein
MSRKSLIKISLAFVIIFSIFSIFLKTTNAAAKYFYWFMNGNNKIELGDDKKGTGFDTKAACEILLKNVGAGLTKSPSCYTGEIAKVTSMSPASGKPGDLVTINGDGFNFIKSISFNGVAAEKDGIISSSQTKIMVVVPSGATTGVITVTTTYRGIAKTPVFTINTAGLSWWFINEAKQVVGTKGVHGFPGFTTKALCETAQAPYKSSITSSVGECFQDTDVNINKLIAAEQEASKIFTDTVLKKDEPVSVAAKINVPENNTVYKMLAPLGTITCMDWSTPKDPNSKCIGNNIGEYLNFIFKFLIGLCAALAVIMLIISGITYMGDESVFGKTEAKSKMFSAILGLLIALGAYALLNTINPDLTGVNGLKIDQVSAEIDAIEYISPDSYTKITGQKVLTATEYDTMGRKVAKEMGIPFCAIRVILERESKGNPGAIGFDENVTNPGIPSRRAFVNSGIKYTGESFTPSDTLITQKSFINQTKDSVQNTPGLGIDWRFSKGLGLTQITLFPDGYFSNPSYTTNPPALNKNYYPTLNGLTPRDLLDPEKNLKAGAQIWKQSWVACKSDIYGAWVGYGGGPGKCSTSNAFLIKEATVRTEYYNGCSPEDKNI